MLPTIQPSARRENPPRSRLRAREFRGRRAGHRPPSRGPPGERLEAGEVPLVVLGPDVGRRRTATARPCAPARRTPPAPRDASGSSAHQLAAGPRRLDRRSASAPRNGGSRPAAGHGPPRRSAPRPPAARRRRRPGRRSRWTPGGPLPPDRLRGSAPRRRARSSRVIQPTIRTPTTTSRTMKITLPSRAPAPRTGMRDIQGIVAAVAIRDRGRVARGASWDRPARRGWAARAGSADRRAPPGPAPGPRADGTASAAPDCAAAGAPPARPGRRGAAPPGRAGAQAKTEEI